MNFLLTTFLFLQARTPHVNPDATPYPATSGGFDPFWFIIATVAIVGLLAFGFWKLGWHWPGKGKGTGSGNVFKNDPPAGGI